MNINQNVEQSNLKSIQTEIIRPIQINQDTCTFVFRNIGHLDKHTKITLAAVSKNITDAANNNYSYPLSCGIASLIRSARLVANGVEIASNDNVAHWVAMSSHFEPVQFRDNVSKCRLGIYNTFQPSRVGSNSSGANANKQGKLTLKSLNWPIAAGNVEVVDSQGLHPNYQLTGNAETTMRGYISMEQLFPKMYNAAQLPLMFIKDEVSLVLQFNKNGLTPRTNHRMVGNAAELTEADEVSCDIILDEVEMLVDYLHYFDNSAVASKVMGDGYTLTYGDLDYNNFSMVGLPQVGGVRNTKKYTFNLGLTGLTIRQMYLIYAPDVQTEQNAGDAWKKQHPIQGNFCSIEPTRLDNGLTLQIKINGQNLYVNPIQNSAEHLERLCEAYGSRYESPMSVYCQWDNYADDLDAKALADGGGNRPLGSSFHDKCLLSSQSQVNGHSIIQLSGSAFYNGIDLQKPVLTADGTLAKVDIPGAGTTITNTPVFIEITRDIPDGNTNDNRNLIVVSCIEKNLIIKNGLIQVI